MEQDRAVASTRTLDVSGYNRDLGLQISGPGKLPTHTKQRGRPMLPLPGVLCLFPNAGRELAHGEGNGEHDAKGEKIGLVVDVERVIGRDEPEVEGRDAQQRCDYGRSAAILI